MITAVSATIQFILGLRSHLVIFPSTEFIIGIIILGCWPNLHVFSDLRDEGYEAVRAVITRENSE